MIGKKFEKKKKILNCFINVFCAKSRKYILPTFRNICQTLKKKGSKKVPPLLIRITLILIVTFTLIHIV